MSDVFLIFCAWFIFSCAFHVLLFTKWKKKGERFWKATDYWWICVGLIGLWGVAEEYERQQTTNRVHMQEASLEHEYSDQQSWIVTLMNSQIQVALLKMEETPNAGVGTRREVTQHIYEHSLYTRLQQAMSLKRPLNRHREELEAVIRDIHADPNGKTVAAEAGLLLNRAIGEEDELDRLRGEAKNAQHSRIWLALAPLLLAAALALRLTRVTAEVFVLPKSKVRSGPDESQAQA
jgi:hypothetical protein